ncbi:hypothetical protein B566_EDAN008862 [Ephemera danica]|nr:hypothetical protein B566_EDAN008862 [Ephemera danica]
MKYVYIFLITDTKFYPYRVPFERSVKKKTILFCVTVKPISANIMSSGQPLSADRKYELECMTVGSRPPAKISWWKDNKKLDHYNEKISGDGNSTTSTLIFTPTMLDHDKSLTCRADNKHVQAGVEEATWKLNIFFVPVVHLELGSSLNPNDIEEGDDVYFECKVHGNPAAYKVIWKHNVSIKLYNILCVLYSPLHICTFPLVILYNLQLR